MNLAASLEKFTSAFFRDNPQINYGGCAVFAAEMGKDLQALGYTTRCIVFGTGGGMGTANHNLNDVASKLEQPKSIYDWNDHDVTFYHIMLEAEGNGEHFLVDGEGVYNPDKTEYNGRGRYDGYVPVDYIAAMAQDASAWNSMFPRNTIPKVRASIKQFVEDLKNANL